MISGWAAIKHDSCQSAYDNTLTGLANTTKSTTTTKKTSRSVLVINVLNLLNE